jgi:quercetin 2,3-dioxygenase
MAAGRGIVHSEMPVATTGDLWGFLLWINLHAKDKMTKPRYQDILAAELPSVAGSEGGAVRVLAGHYGGKQGALISSHHSVKCTCTCAMYFIYRSITRES